MVVKGSNLVPLSPGFGLFFSPFFFPSFFHTQGGYINIFKNPENNTRKETTRLENELTRLIDSDSQDSAEKIRLIELEILQKEQEFLEQQLKFKENFTLLEDERATKKNLNLESTKGGITR